MSKVVHEGWMVRYGRRKIGKSFLHMRYFVLETRLLAYFKTKPQGNAVSTIYNAFSRKIFSRKFCHSKNIMWNFVSFLRGWCSFVWKLSKLSGGIRNLSQETVIHQLFVVVQAEPEPEFEANGFKILVL